MFVGASGEPDAHQPLHALIRALPKISFGLFAAFLISMAVRSHNDTTLALVISSVLMFAACWANATHLMGHKAALKFVAIAVCLGWFAEQMGSSRGWFFGSYSYTDVLGWRLGDVPMVIPLMWFALCYVGYIIAHLSVFQSPLNTASSVRRALFMAFVAAMIVTAYDLGADPYFVFVLKAWIMTKTDGWWFGETLQGFVGWVSVATVIIFCFHLATRNANGGLGLQMPIGFQKKHVLLPLGVYAFSMVFQMVEGHPVETRTVAFFAMGLPLLFAFAGWWRWQPKGVDENTAKIVSNARLSQLQYIADPLADDTMTRILGPWPAPVTVQTSASQFAKIAQVNRQFAGWTQNQSIVNWPGDDPHLSSEIRAALQQYLNAGKALPEWADRAKIERAEALFMDYGALSCTLLFCASLPECYVIPDLASVLHASGQLEQHTDYRVRSTAAMIFPVMMKGGLCRPEGGGVAQILKVRLIHATIRHLILRGSPADALTALGDQRDVPNAGIVPPLPMDSFVSSRGMHETLLAHGWRVGADGLPCNQEELAYTLLTFSYVFLRGMRDLGLALEPADEEAYLHTWNVVGHVLGIRRELLADTMIDAAALFAQMQARGRAHPVTPDPRPALGGALMNAMASVIPFGLLKGFPALMTRYLCGKTAANEVGVYNHTSWLSQGLFFVLMAVTRLVDTVVRWVLPEFSISRFFTRVIGYHLMSNLLLSQTRPLKLPTHLLNEVERTLGQWSDDPKAPGWLNRLEDRLTHPGLWNGAAK